MMPSMRSYVISCPDGADQTGDPLHPLAALLVEHDARRRPIIIDLADDPGQVLATIQANSCGGASLVAAVAAHGMTAEPVSDSSFAKQPDPARICVYPPRIVHWCAGCRRGRSEGHQRCLTCQHDVFYTTDHNTVWLNGLDFPTGHAINQNADLQHDPRCSSAQTNGAVLCDCAAIEREWERLVATHSPTAC